MSFKTWCLAIRPGAFLHTVETLGIHLFTTWTAAWDAQTQAEMHTDSNTHCFIIKPQTTAAIGRASSQSPLCGAKDAKNLAFCDGSTKEFSMSARLALSPRLSQKDCLPGNGSGGGPPEVDQDDRYESRNESVGQGNCASICSWRTRILAAEAKKAGAASEVTRRIPGHQSHHV